MTVCTVCYERLSPANNSGLCRYHFIAKTREVQRRMAGETVTPFERQLEKVRNGAGLVNVIPVRRPNPEGTLGGVASGMLG